jgi:hypothetical protein
MRSIEHLKSYRQLYLQLTDGLTTEQLLKVPQGHRNNILWNLGHVVVSQQLLHYALAGRPMYVSEEWVGMFRKGTSPAGWSTPPDLAQIRKLAIDLPERIEADYASGRHADYNTYTTSAGVTLETIEDALEFNNFHEGLHLGVVMSLCKLVRA